MDLDRRILAQLSEIEARGELRSLETARGIDFSSNDYLGLANDPRMKQAVAEGVQRATRIASTGSRLLSGHDDAWTELERDFAAWIGAEAALYFTSGYAANVGLLSAAVGPDDVVFSDSANHASLIDGMRLAKCRRVIFPHLDLHTLELELRRHAPGAKGARAIVVESLFSMEGDVAPLAELAALAARYEAHLIVDEAHATGVRGPRGRGVVAEAGLDGRVFATIHTCGKALASAGAFVCGSAALRQFLINRARTFIFSTALPPYFAEQVRAGMQLAIAADAQRAHLAESPQWLRGELTRLGFDTASSASQIVPVVLGTSDAARFFAEQLKSRGFGVRAIRPPTVPPGTARLRLSLTSALTRETLRHFVEAAAQVRHEFAAALSVSAPR